MTAEVRKANLERKELERRESIARRSAADERRRQLAEERRCTGQTKAGTRCRNPAGAGKDLCATHDPERFCGAPVAYGRVCHQIKEPGAETCWTHDPENICSIEECEEPRWQVPSYPEREALGYALSAQCWSHDPNGRLRQERQNRARESAEEAAQTARSAAFTALVNEVRGSSLHACPSCGPTLIASLFSGRYVESPDALWAVIGFHAAGHRGQIPWTLVVP